MPLDTSTKRRSSVGICQPWMLAPPSPTDTAGTVDQADQQHGAWSYSGILAVVYISPALNKILMDYYHRRQRGR